MKIAILGGGVAGLSAAIALVKKGFGVDVFERHKSSSDIGAGIVCWPNASFVLDKLGMLNDMKKVSGTPDKMRRLSSQGEHLGEIDLRILNGAMGYESYSILRKDMMEIFERHAYMSGVNIHYNHNVKELNSNESGYAQVTFEIETQIKGDKPNKIEKKLKADLIIGAEGRMNSTSRAFVCGDNSPVYQGFINWVGVFQSETAFFEDISVFDYWGVGARFGIVPICEKTAYWAGGVASKTVEKKVSVNDKNELKSLFQDWPNPVLHVIENSPPKSINKIYVHDHNPIDVWYRDNVLLIGDAAHAPLPTSGQGACQALEDAWLLAEILSDKNADMIEGVTTGDAENLTANLTANLTRSFNLFNQRRLEKTSNIIMGGRHFAASLYNDSEDFCAERNAASKNMDFNAVAKGMARGWANGLPL